MNNILHADFRVKKISRFFRYDFAQRADNELIADLNGHAYMTDETQDGKAPVEEELKNRGFAYLLDKT